VAKGGAVGFGRFPIPYAGTPGSLRLNLNASFFQLNSFPVSGLDQLLTGELSVGYTFYPGIEIFGAYDNSSNYNTRAHPSIIQAQGDVQLGFKAGGHIGGLRLAAIIGGDLKNGFGADNFTAGTSAFTARGLISYGGKAGPGTLELAANAGAIVGKDTQVTATELNGPYSALLFGSGLSAYYQFVGGLVLHYDTSVVSPFLGIDFDEPLNVSKATFQASKTTLGMATSKDIEVGLRVQTGQVGAFDFAVDAGFGSGTIGFAKTPPYMLTAAYSFVFDPTLYNPPPPPPPPAPPPPPKEVVATLRGTILDRTTGAPIFGVVVTPTGSLPVATGPDGSFTTRPLKPGNVAVKLDRTGYQGGLVTFPVTEASTPFQIKLDPIPAAPAPAPVVEAPPPPLPTGYVAGSITGPDGGISADIHITGTTTQDLRSTMDGSFSAKLFPGRYTILVAPDGFYARSTTVTVATDQAVPVVLRTTPRKAMGAVSIENDAIKFSKPFALDEKRVAPAPTQVDVLAEVADIVVRNPDRKLVISVYSDVHGKADRLDWTEQRAQAIRDALVAAGAPADRLEAHGYGTSQLLLPEKPSSADNRRVGLQLVPLQVAAPVQMIPTPSGGSLVPLPPMTP
jgi:outer membrane protein OmpA-like peptidoglycan-associated protein